MKKLFIIVSMMAILACGCSESPQEKASYEAQKAEQDAALFITPMAFVLVVKYQEVIRMDPKTTWAEKSQQRIDVLRKIMQDDENARRARGGI